MPRRPRGAARSDDAAPAEPTPLPLPILVDGTLCRALLPALGEAAPPGATDGDVFHLLRASLLRDRRVLQLADDPAAWDRLAHGSIVELEGMLAPNHLEQMLGIVAEMAPVASGPLLEGTEGDDRASLQASLDLLRLVAEQLQAGSTRDLLFQVPAADMVCVVVLPRHAATIVPEDWLGMRVHLLAKVVQVLGRDSQLSLLRRSAVGSATATALQAGVDELADAAGLELATTDLDVHGPSLVLLLLALHV